MSPPATSTYLKGMWRYARATAYLGKGQTNDADQELAKLNGLMGDKSLDGPLFSPNTARTFSAVWIELCRKPFVTVTTKTFFGAPAWRIWRRAAGASA